MKKLLAVILAGLMLASAAAMVSADDLANYAASATATEWVAGETEGTTCIEFDLGAIKPLGYYEITWGDKVPSDFVISAKSSVSDGYSDQTTVTGNTDATTVIELTPYTSRYVKITVTGTDTYEVKGLVVRKTKDEVANTNVSYPSSGITAPEGSTIITGTIIGNETGWGDNADTGAKAAFDGDINTFFDPLAVGDGYCGIDAGTEFVLTKIAVHPRDAQLARFYGASIQGTNTPDDENSWTDIWVSVEEATEWVWYEIDQADFDDTSATPYRYYRYYNMLSHGDVAEVELYGYTNSPVAAVETEAETEAVVEETEAVVEETVEEAAEETVVAPVETATETAPQTFDAGVIAAAAAVISAAGYAISKKRK